EADPLHPPVWALDRLDQALGLQPRGQAGDVALGDHQPARDLAKRQAGLAGALEGGEEVEARQGGAEVLAQALGQALFHRRGAGQQAEPQAQAALAVRGAAEAVRQGLDRAHASPPATGRATPFTPPLSGRHSQATAAATSAGWISRPWGLAATRAARASA